MNMRAADPPLSPLDTWYGSILGRELATQEEECLERMLQDTFGYYLLQLGSSTGFSEAIHASRIRQRILLPRQAAPHTLGIQVAASPGSLPIAADSVAADPRQVLRETERVLIPEGRLVLLGFNALSMWGAWSLVRRRQGRVPWCGNFLTPYRVGDWLSLLGFDIEMQEMMMFRPPWRRALLKELSFLDSMGRRFWPLVGGVYAIRAVKRVSTLTPMRPFWKSRRPVLAGGAVEPTARGAAERGIRPNDSMETLND